ncbi:hypothetical protein FA13DRAFT_1801991 [Coprinellus micaceus]|uniref:Uncharacterized protein n=1 Tax=Coprinellus micaceus TaxID=71717 RepID=A0A4Y7SDB6_COPMI|nr:hypothetical protein FA13DRAFT_1801991 [Coprinellus micaceus]
MKRLTSTQSPPPSQRHDHVSAQSNIPDASTHTSPLSFAALPFSTFVPLSSRHLFNKPGPPTRATTTSPQTSNTLDSSLLPGHRTYTDAAPSINALLSTTARPLAARRSPTSTPPPFPFSHPPPLPPHSTVPLICH